MEAAGFEGDVRKQEDAKRVVESAFKHFGRVDILVNAAAGNFLVSAEDLSPNGFRTGCVLHKNKGYMVDLFSFGRLNHRHDHQISSSINTMQIF